jgi:Dockerin type I domain
MEIIIVLIAIVVIGAIWYVNRDTGFDANKDGKVDLKDAGVMLEQTVKEVKEEIKEVADVNKDGKVDSADAKVVAEKAKETVKKTATKVKAAASKPRKPKTPKA